MPLHYLEFDHCEDSDGLHSWDAVASPAPHHNRTLLTEVRGVLAQLQNALGPAGPLDEGHAWDMDLQMHDEHQRLWTLEAVDACPARLTLSLSLSGGTALADLLAGLAQD